MFDSRPIAVLAEQLLPGKGEALATAWRTRQFEYTWLHNGFHRYEDFAHLSADALTSAAKSLSLPLSAETRAVLLRSLAQLSAWPDALPMLQLLRKAGHRLALLSDLTSDMLLGCVRASRAGHLFDHVLSTDLAQAYKPDPGAYRLALEAFGLPRERMVFVASADWDAAGARSFGFRTFWVDRNGQAPEQLGFQADVTGINLTGLPEFAAGRA